MMCNYEEAMDNLATIREMAKQYRREMTIAAGIVCRIHKVSQFENYVKVMDELTLDEFCGNQLSGLFDPMTASMYRDVLDGKVSFIEMYSYWLNENQIEELKERLNAE